MSALRRRRVSRRGPLVERIAGWSARHAKTAVIGWFVLVGVAFLAGQLLGTQSLPQYDPGQTGTAEQALHRLNITTAPTESVLIQASGPAAASRTYASDPQIRQAVASVAAALSKLPAAAADIRAAGSLPPGRDPGGQGRPPRAIPPAPPVSSRPTGAARW